MGIIPTLRERGYEMQRLQMVDRNGREEAHMDLTPLYDAQRGRFISVARSELASALVGACQGLPIHFNVSISAIAKDGAKSLVTLTDGRQERFDLVVGADGLHSHVRALSFGPETQFERFLDCYVAAFRIRGYPLREELTFVSHTVRGRQAARVSLRDDETMVLLVCGTERIGADHHGHGDPRPVLRQAYGDMGWEVPELLDAMDAAEDVYFDRVSQIHLPHWGAAGVARPHASLPCRREANGRSRCCRHSEMRSEQPTAWRLSEPRSDTSDSSIPRG